MNQEPGMSISLPPGTTKAKIYKIGSNGLTLAGVLNAISSSGNEGQTVFIELEDLKARAAKLYPNSPYLQAEWIRAVGVVRAQRGWVLDRGTPRPSWRAA